MQYSGKHRHQYHHHHHHEGSADLGGGSAEEGAYTVGDSDMMVIPQAQKPMGTAAVGRVAWSTADNAECMLQSTFDQAS
jgi:hypothetical protein